MTDVYGIVSGRGGVGKTTLVANLGVALSRLGKSTLIVDADLALGTLELFFGLKETPVTLHDVLNGEAEMHEAIYKSANSVHIIPSGSSLQGFLKCDLERFTLPLSRFQSYDFILIDTPSGLTKYSLVPLKAVDKRLLVVTPDFASLSSALKLKLAAEMLDSNISSIIINKQRKAGIKKEEIKNTLGIEILGEIPHDRNVLKAMDAKNPVVTYKPKTPASKALTLISRKMAGMGEEESMTQRLQKLLHRKQNKRGVIELK